MSRRYQGHDGRWWTVEAVSPGEPGVLRDRRMVAGWLSFQSDCGEAIYVAPVPTGWNALDTDYLEALRAAGKAAGYTDRRVEGRARAERP